MPGKPYLDFYVGDWRKDPGVQSCTYEQRGVWFEMLLFMHESPEYGKLVLNGTPMTEDDIVEMVSNASLSGARAKQILSKLLVKGVAKRDKDTGVIYCARMVRKAELSEIRAAAGSIGGTAKAKQTSSKSGSKSLANSDNDTDSDTEDVKKNNTYSDDFEKAWSEYPRRSGGNPKKLAWKAWKARISEGEDPSELIEATKQYAEYIRAAGNYGTSFVMQASTFYGPNERWRDNYTTEKREGEQNARFPTL